MILLKRIRWKNFLKTGNEYIEVDLTAHQTTLIIGKNGAGKSTLLDAVTYLLFGRPFRDVKLGLLTNTITRRDMVVEGWLEIDGQEYHIIRGDKPKIFEVYRNDVLLNQDADSRDYQATLEKHIVKMNVKSFRQIICLGNAAYTPFMKLRAGERREVVEDLLDLQIFSVMNLLLKRKMEEDSDLEKETDTRLEHVQEKIRIIQGNAQASRDAVDRLIAEKNDRIREAMGDIEKANVSLKFYDEHVAELQGQIEDATKVEKKANELGNLRVKIKTRLEASIRNREFFDKNESCPTCLQDLSDDHKKEMVARHQVKIDELETGFTKLEAEYAKVDAKLTHIRKLNQEIGVHLSKKTNTEAQKRASERYLSELERDITSLRRQGRMEVDAGRLTELQEQEVELKGLLSMLANRRDLCRHAVVLLKDGGIKASIVRQYVPIINKLINKYLAAMDFFVRFELDENFDEKILSRHRDEFVYNSFSEGEKFKINIAILFAWRELAQMRNSVHTNLLIMDETLDSSLDQDGIDSFMRLLDTIKEQNNVFVISHKSDQMIDKFANVVKFKANRNFSVLEAA